MGGNKTTKPKGKIDLSNVNPQKFLKPDDLVKEGLEDNKTQVVQERQSLDKEEKKLTDKIVRTLKKKKKSISIPIEYEEAIKEIQQESDTFEAMGVNIEFYIMEAIKESLKRDGY